MQGGVRKRGSSWYYYFEAGKIDGKRKKIERKGGKTKKEAQIALRNAIAELENTGSPLLESNISVADYFNYWFDNYVLTNCKYNTQQYYRRIIDGHIVPSFGSLKLKQVTSKRLQEFINKKYLEGYAKSSVAAMLGVIKKGFRMANKPYKFIKNSPAEEVKLPSYSKDFDDDNLKIISKDDFACIMNRFPENSTFYIPLQIAFHTGMRASEVCGLTWSNVDFEKKIIKIRSIMILKKGKIDIGTPKTPASKRNILIGAKLLEILKKHKNKQEENKEKYGEYYIESDYVCTRENGKIVTMDTIKYLSRVINYELMIPFNFHSLRHTHATMLIEAGVNIKYVQKRLGHDKISTTLDTYSHVTESMEETSIKTFENFIEE
ncbi:MULTISPECIES: site-specific integrase [Bacillus]|uniref:site-specific integrase n=1 Tax=Bacillus TaxID=1386 RepID=UPI000301EC42|nr:MULTISPECIES: site-specific integrase [Bacillus]